MSGIIFCICSTLFISIPSTVSKRCRKEHKKMQVKKRVRAKSEPMMNLVSRYRVRNPTVLASIESENPENTKSESQKVPLISFNVQLTSTEKPVTLANSANFSEWNNDDKWSSQVQTSGEMSKSCTVRPVPNKLVIDIDLDADTAAESDLSLSFLNRVND